eukprot:8386181-Prorocentrum_lima.AAC.1
MPWEVCAAVRGARKLTVEDGPTKVLEAPVLVGRVVLCVLRDAVSLRDFSQIQWGALYLSLIHI